LATDIRAPTHELTIARDVLRTRRRDGRSLGADGLRGQAVACSIR
jgi:hypothetical protein